MSSHDAVVLLEEFQSRYERDYDLRTATSHGAGRGGRARDPRRRRVGGDVRHRLEAARRRPHRRGDPSSARRGAHRSPRGRGALGPLLADGTGHRTGLAKGKYDAYRAPTPEDEVAKAPSPRDARWVRPAGSDFHHMSRSQPGLRPSIESLPNT